MSQRDISSIETWNMSEDSPSWSYYIIALPADCED